MTNSDENAPHPQAGPEARTAGRRLVVGFASRHARLPGITAALAAVAARAGGQVVDQATVDIVMPEEVETCHVVETRTGLRPWADGEAGNRSSGAAAARRAKKKRQNKARRGGR